jgi:hypothetical protein
VIIVEEILAEAQFYRVCEKSGPGSFLCHFILDLWSKQPKQVIEGDERYPKDMLVGRNNVWQQIGSNPFVWLGTALPEHAVVEYLVGGCLELSRLMIWG